jgi:hypothetical protein
MKSKETRSLFDKLKLPSRSVFWICMDKAEVRPPLQHQFLALFNNNKASISRSKQRFSI